MLLGCSATQRACIENLKLFFKGNDFDKALVIITSATDTTRCLDYDFNKVNLNKNQTNKKLSLIHPDTITYSTGEYCDMV